MNETFEISPALLDQIKAEPEYVWRIGMDVLITDPALLSLRGCRTMTASISETAAWKDRERLIRVCYTPAQSAPYKTLKGEFIALAHFEKRIALVLGEDGEIVERYDP